MNIKNFKITTLALILFAGITSCEKDDNNTPTTPNNPPSTSSGFIRSKINGIMKTADTKVGATFTDEQNVKAVTIKGQNSDANHTILFTMILFDFKGVGTYKFGEGILLSSATYYESDFGNYLVGTYYTDTKGTAIVTEYTVGKSIKGTFELKANKSGTKTLQDITDGEFTISLK